MIVACSICSSNFDDEYRYTVCPHDTFAANDGNNNFAHHPESHLSPALSAEDRNERFIQYAVREFEVAIRMMIRDKSALHFFDFEGTKDGVTELWSFLICAGTKREMVALENLMGGSQPSKEISHEPTCQP